MRKKLKETISIGSSFTYTGIFQKIASLQSNPFSDFINASNSKELDDLYYFERSGDKDISLAFDRYIELEDNNIISSALDYITANIVTKFERKWLKDYQLLVTTTYNPINNYDMVEETTRNIKIDNTNYDNVFAFNTSSTDGVPSGKSGTTTEGLAEDNVESHTRSGNIGVMTTQALMNEELSLRNKHNFIDHIMADVDTVMCSAIYCLER